MGSLLPPPPALPVLYDLGQNTFLGVCFLIGKRKGPDLQGGLHGPFQLQSYQQDLLVPSFNLCYDHHHLN